MNKAIVKEVLPTEPLDPRLEPWWIAHVVNLGEGCCSHACGAAQPLGGALL